ncbi:hypothetical protein C8C83_1936 [Flavobacterium sp. 90]|uniref:hypothetical protein n=1 Tax=unclassified Flavobacterium TaxID=196869 RepID=UPI000EAC885D|nr:MULTISPECIES: hypothetical protein [unclassified Flavobacterium]RKR10263.1 hypothetical protein C8C82_2239 [Flavobacterium sp. 81]TCK54048.1 hypothetical protein C8C83_1936 [Flavobacterium sp. 90]
MVLSTKKYFLYIIFLVSPMTLSLYAQSTAERPAISTDSNCKLDAFNALNQKNDIADNNISKLENSNHCIVGLSIPKDSSAVANEVNTQSSNCDENSSITYTYSALAKDIIENYKYDFSETFIDILFFERIDLARTRTI